MLVSLPEDCPAVGWRVEACSWKLSWYEQGIIQEKIAAAGDVIEFPDITEAVAAIPVSPQGFNLGPGAGVILRWQAEDQAPMNYELGWLSELVIAMQQDGMNVRRINIERIHASGYSGSGGRPFLLDKQTVLRAIRNGTLGASSFKPEYV
ncbi:MAG: hypothetical protein D6B26_06775, partial [Spirochaetaceae bacterium]